MKILNIDNTYIYLLADHNKSIIDKNKYWNCGQMIRKEEINDFKEINDSEVFKMLASRDNELTL